MPAEDEVHKASTQLYAALNRLVQGDAGPLTDIWSHSATVTAMHPIGGREVGWDNVRGSFEQGQLKIGGHEVSFEDRVTNIYLLEAGAWKIVDHHADIAPEMLDPLSRL